MTVLIVLSLAAASVWLASRYVVKAREYLDAGSLAWDRLETAAKEIISDPTMPNRAVGFTAAAVLCSGCGCFATHALLDAAKAKFRKPEIVSPKDSVFVGLTDHQRALTASVVANALLYDALRVPLRGFILRRFVFPWLDEAAKHPGSKAIKSKVARVAASTREAMEEKPEAKKLLAMA